MNYIPEELICKIHHYLKIPKNMTFQQLLTSYTNNKTLLMVFYTKNTTNETIENYMKDLHLLYNLCLKYNAKLIMISTTSVYGTQSTLVNESCKKNDLRPQSPYAEYKLKEENFVKKLNKKNNLRCTILRFGTIYGTSQGMRFHTAVNKFCFQASNNQPITIWKTAYNQKRPYLEINDAIRSLVFVIKNNLFDGEILNVLTGNHTVKDVVSKIKIYKKNISLRFVNNKIMNQLSYEVSNDKFKKKGFKFRGNMKKAIKTTLILLNNINNNSY